MLRMTGLHLTLFLTVKSVTARHNRPLSCTVLRSIRKQHTLAACTVYTECILLLSSLLNTTECNTIYTVYA